LRVSVKGGDGKYQFVEITVDSKAKVKDVIGEVLKAGSTGSHILFRNQDPSAYQVRNR
jgi:hypothetical protein